MQSIMMTLPAEKYKEGVTVPRTVAVVIPKPEISQEMRVNAKRDIALCGSRQARYQENPPEGCTSTTSLKFSLPSCLVVLELKATGRGMVHFTAGAGKVPGETSAGPALANNMGHIIFLVKDAFSINNSLQA
jgi:hypothetical protein